MPEERKTLSEDEILTTSDAEQRARYGVTDADADDTDADTDDSDADADTDDPS
jgi:hypothetical protein